VVEFDTYFLDNRLTYRPMPVVPKQEGTL